MLKDPFELMPPGPLPGSSLAPNLMASPALSLSRTEIWPRGEFHVQGLRDLSSSHWKQVGRVKSYPKPGDYESKQLPSPSASLRSWEPHTTVTRGAYRSLALWDPLTTSTHRARSPQPWGPPRSSCPHMRLVSASWNERTCVCLSSGSIISSICWC